jgi:hypothetical protein
VKSPFRTVASLCRRIYDLALRGDIQVVTPGRPG